ncbi:MAG: T9SS type A sorting domain-containing protein, partial [Saprospiraceae bacterium]|nr:T9SS type A sorting domain-containing protein [Saprospiraceae bacterium]
MGQFIVKAAASGTLEKVEDNLQFYPNPASETVFFQMENSLSENAFCYVHNSLGQLVLQQTLPISKGRGSMEMGKFPTGPYTIQMLSGGKTYSGIFVKK